jgi:hypothetical protein
MHIDQGSAGAAVAHPVHHLPEGGAGRGGEVVPGMPQIVKVHISQPSLSQSR